MSGPDSRTKITRLQLEGGAFTLVDAEDFPVLSRNIWVLGDGYARLKGYGEIVIHRLVMGARRGQQIDHINRDTLDNRKQNLRVCTAVENAHNHKRRRDNKTGFVGIQPNRRRFTARICASKRVIYLGCFPAPEDAARAYDRAAVRHFGEFARLNFPEERDVHLRALSLEGAST